MRRFQTLLLREWMQHRTGWLLLALVPLGLTLLAVTFGSVTHDEGDQLPIFGLMAAGGFAVGMVLLAWTVVGLQASGLARRDQQDRSIEFWRSLPVSDEQALSATLLAHGLLMPLGITAVALAGSVPVGLLIQVKGYGLASLSSLPWGLYGQVLLAAVPRFLLGTLLASLWAAPLLLLGMAASAWLKRWGVPVVVLVLGTVGLVMDKVYGLPQLLDALQALFNNFGAALVPLVEDGVHIGVTADLPGLLMQDLWRRVQDLASPLCLLALAVSAGSFMLLLMRRRRAG